MKRFLTIVPLGLLVGVAAWGQLPKCEPLGTNDDYLGIHTIKLWPGAVPEAKGSGCNDTPTLTIFDPQQGNANESAVVIFPGGGYQGLSGNLEGRQVADWFASRGFRAFVLNYRLSGNGYLLPVPLIDARRAIETVRARARDYQIDPHRIVVIGFSAGGHLAALAGTKFVPGNPEAEDPVERVSSRPDYLVLGYPWIEAVSADTSHLNYCKLYHVMDQCAALRAAYSPELLVTKETPPTFLYHTVTDELVPVEQGLAFFEALLKSGVPAEAHFFSKGGHGSGLGRGDAALDQWPNLLEIWLRAQGLLDPAKPKAEKP